MVRRAWERGGKASEPRRVISRRPARFLRGDARYVALAALSESPKAGKLKWDVVQNAMKDFGIKEDKKNPLLV